MSNPSAGETPSIDEADNLDEASDLVNQLLHTATSLLERSVVRGGLARVRLMDAIDAAGLPTSSVYRHLKRTCIEGRPQDVFETLLIRHVERAAIVDDSRPTMVEEATWARLDRERIAGLSAVERGHLLAEMIRTGGLVNAAAYERNTSWRLFVSAATMREDGPDWGATEVVRHMRFIRLYREVATTFHLRLREGFEWQHFAAAAAGLAGGLAGIDDGDTPPEVYAKALLPLVFYWFVPTEDPPYTVLPPLDDVIDADGDVGFARVAVVDGFL